MIGVIFFVVHFHGLVKTWDDRDLDDREGDVESAVLN